MEPGNKSVNDAQVNKLLESIQSLSEAESQVVSSGNGESITDGSRKRSLEEDVEMEDVNAKKHRKKFKRFKKMKPVVMKTALMKLNETFPGLEYKINNMGGPPHQPMFEASVVVENQTFDGRGKSKQMAKLAAAVSALRSFIQFPDMAEAQQIINYTEGILRNGSEISSGDVQKALGENKINVPISDDKAVHKPIHHVVNSPKNPVMLLNELQAGLTYSVVEERGEAHNKRFTMSVEFQGESYFGTGKSKKLAKAAAAAEVLQKRFNIKVSTLEIGSPAVVTTPDSSDYAHLVVPIPQDFADKIEQTINMAFDDLMKDLNNYRKHLVLAGIVMTNDKTQEMKVLTLSTGTKCINGEHISVHGAAINDCHAEIISRRCLIDFLYTQLETRDKDPSKSILEKQPSGKFSVIPEVKFHLYINTAPCGDARIFSPKEIEIHPDKHPLRKCRGQLRTKIESGEGTIPVVNFENTMQTWDSILAGNRLLTMSCSDKVARWMVVGLQGSLLSHLIDPIYLDTITLGRLYHPEHMHRALNSRFASALQDLPPPYELRSPAMAKTRNTKTRQPNKAPNHCVNWTTGHIAPEVINAITGKIDGQTPSRLCKRQFFKRFNDLKQTYPRLKNISNIYHDAKMAASDYQKAKKALNQAFVSSGLGQWMEKPLEQDQFSLAELDTF